MIDNRSYTGYVILFFFLFLFLSCLIYLVLSVLRAVDGWMDGWDGDDYWGGLKMGKERREMVGNMNWNGMGWDGMTWNNLGYRSLRREGKSRGGGEERVERDLCGWVG